MVKPPLRPLSEKELEAFYDEVDHDNDGRVSLSELEKRLEAVHKEIAPKPARHNLHHPDRLKTNAKKGDGGEKQTSDSSGTSHQSDLHDFLYKLLPERCREEGCTSISKEEFIAQVRSWKIPSQNQDPASAEQDEKGKGKDDEQADAKDYDKKLPLSRRLKAWWSVRGPEVIFLLFVFGLQAGMGIWQLEKYLNYQEVRSTLGWGAILAKARQSQ